MSKSVTELLERLQQKVHDARELLDGITDATPEGEAAEIRAKHDAVMDEFDKLEAEHAEAKRLADAEARVTVAAASDSPLPDVRDSDAGDTDSEARYRDAFFAHVRSVATREPLSEDHRAVLQERALSVGTNSAGGYLVPEGFQAEVEKRMLTYGPMMDPGTHRSIVTTSGADIPWPTVDDTANSGEGHAESGALTETDPVFGSVTLKAYVRDSKIVKIPVELMQDSAFDLQDVLSDLFAERLARGANYLRTEGSGTDEPQGFMNGATEGLVAAAGTGITSDEIIQLYHDVDPMYRDQPMAQWHMHDQVLREIRKLKDGQGNYLWEMGDLRSGEPNMLLGKPYYINNDMTSFPTEAGDGNDVLAFGDFSKFIVRSVSGMNLRVLNELYAANMQIGMFMWHRWDSRMIQPQAIKYLRLSNI